MRAARLVCCTLVLVACSKAEETPAVDSAAPTVAPAPAATIAIADLVGKWKQETRTETSDSVIVTSEVNATADPAGWTLTLPGRPVMPLRVTVSGDSLITGAGPYESVLRKGVQVTTEGTLRKQGDKLVGITRAHYQGAKGADSVVTLRTELTRVP
jgi:hypothetical protein